MSNPYAEFATDSAAPTPGGVSTSAGANPYSEFATSKSTDSDKPKFTSKIDEYAPGFVERGIGTDQFLNQVGAGRFFPTFRGGKLSLGLPPQKELAEHEQVLEDNNKGVGRTALEMATDPATYLPMKGGLLAAGAKQGGISSLFAPSTDPNQTLKDRLEGAGLGSLMGAGTGGIMHAIGMGAGATGDMIKGIKDELMGVKPNLTGKTSQIYDMAKKMGITFTGKENPEEVWGKIKDAVQGKVTQIAENIRPGASADVWSVGTNLATSQMYEGTKIAGSMLYDQAKKIGKDQTMPAEDVIKDLDGFISHMEESAKYHEGIDPNFNTKLNKIRKLRNAISGNENEEKVDLTDKSALYDRAWNNIQKAFNHADTNPPKTLTGAQLIEIDQSINSFYGTKGTGDKANIPVNNLKATFDKAISNMSPEFKEAYSKAKNYWRQNVIQNFQDNSVLHQYWKPEDYEAFKAINKGIELHPDLKARAETLLGKIQTPLDLDELKKALPPEMYDQVRAAKFISMMNKAGINSKVISDDKTYNLLSKTLAHKPDDLLALDTIKTFTEEMNRRGITRELTPAELEVSDKMKDRMMRTAFSFATGHKLYGLRHALELVSGGSPAVAQGRLTGLAKEVAKDTPKTPTTSAPYTPGKVPTTLIKPLATEEGKATQ